MTQMLKLAAQAIRYAWAAPYTLLGIGLALLLGLKVSHRGGALIFEGSGSWLGRPGPHVAVTLGHSIIASAPLPTSVLAHELVHVHQYEQWGPLTVPVWVAGLVIGALRTGHPYVDNPLEREAYMIGEAMNPPTGTCPDCGQPLSRHVRTH